MMAKDNSGGKRLDSIAFRSFLGSRKGFFISASVLLVLVFIVFIVSVNMKQKGENSDFELSTLKARLTKSFITDFKQYYLDSVLRLSMKEAFVAVSNYARSHPSSGSCTPGPGGCIPFTSTNNLSYLLATTAMGENNPYGIALPANSTLGYRMEMLMNSTLFSGAEMDSLGLEIVDIIMSDPYTIRVDWRFTYSLRKLDMSWSEKESGVSFLSINGLWYPRNGEQLRLIGWVSNTSVGSMCYLDSVVRDFDCDGVDGICIGYTDDGIDTCA